MDTTRTLSSGLLRAIRWPAVLVAAVTGLLPHVLLIHNSLTARLTMILVMHVVIVPGLTLLAVNALERRARNLEAANEALRQTADDLERRNRQHDALSAAVRMLSAAPSVAAVLEPLADLARRIVQADWLRLYWSAPGTASQQAVARAHGAAAPREDDPGRTVPLSDGGTELGRLEIADGCTDGFTEASLSVLTSEIGLRWRLRRIEANALSAIYAGGEGKPGIEGPRRTRKLLKILCEAVQADGAGLYVLRAGRWRRRTQYGRLTEADTTTFDNQTGLWRADGGATLCIKGAQDGVLVLHRSGAQPIDTATLNSPLMQMVAGHSATLIRVIDTYQEMLWSERRRIARELHDDVCQSIASVHMQLGHLGNLIRSGHEGAAARCRQLRETALEAYEATRLAVEGFRQEPGLEETGADFLERIARTSCERTGVALDYHAEDVDLDAEAAWQLGRIIQEAVNNAVRHGGAKTICIDLEGSTGSIELTIADDGTFVPPAKEAQEAGGHYGLQIMQERVAGLNGRFSIGQEDGLTALRVVLPSV